jgi:hypothetical protein
MSCRKNESLRALLVFARVQILGGDRAGRRRQRRKFIIAPRDWTRNAEFGAPPGAAS